MSSSSLKVSSSSITKSSSSSDTAEASSVPMAAGRNFTWLIVASLLVTMSLLAAAVLLVTTPSGKQKSAVVRMVDDDSDDDSDGEAVIEGNTGAQPVVRNLPAADHDSEIIVRVKPTRVAIADTTVESSSSHVDAIDDVSAPVGAPQASAPPKKKGARTDDDRCSAEVQFTTCSGNNRDEFFFDAEANECRSKVLERPPACLVGQNRFKSVHDCKLACLDREVSEDRCRTLPLFQRCTAQDIVRQWWYLKNGTCHEWEFKHSTCVSPRLALFESREHCHSTCVAGSPVARHPACSETPVEHPCTPVHMVYPVLAVTRLDNRVACVPTDPSEPKCLTGRNRFRTKKSCRKACLKT